MREDTSVCMNAIVKRVLKENDEFSNQISSEGSCQYLYVIDFKIDRSMIKKQRREHLFLRLRRVNSDIFLSISVCLLMAPSPATCPAFPPSVAEAIQTEGTTARDKECLKLMKYCDL